MPQDTINYSFKKYNIISDSLKEFEDYVFDTSNNFQILDDELYRVETQSNFNKSGWDPEQTWPGITFNDVNYTLSVVAGDQTYWINNVQYTLSESATAQITLVEGVHYFYFTSEGLQTSTTEWTYTSDICPVAMIYWDNINLKHIGIGFELHKWTMSRDIHHYLHDSRGTVYGRGLALNETSTTTLRVDTGSIFDEDIELAIGSLIGTSQVLNDLVAPIYYRFGTQTYIRRIDAGSAVLCYLNPAPQINKNIGGDWQWETVANAKYFAYWVLATHKYTNPIILIPGQSSGGTLNEAKEQNTLESLDLGGLDFAEYVVLARIIMKATPTSYVIEEITDYRTSKVASGQSVSPVATSLMDVLPDIATRDSLENPPTGKQVHVVDASGDFDIYTGWAQYIYTGVAWIRTNEDDANTTFGTFYQDEGDSFGMSTTGQNDFTGNKMGIILTESFKAGGLSLNVVSGRIDHVGKSMILNFNATATIRDPSVPNMTIWFILVKNGTEFIVPSTSFGRIESTSGAMSVDAASAVEVEDGDYLEVFCKTDKLNGSFWVDSMQLQFVEVPQ